MKSFHGVTLFIKAAVVFPTPLCVFHMHCGRIEPKFLRKVSGKTENNEPVAYGT